MSLLEVVFYVVGPQYTSPGMLKVLQGDWLGYFVPDHIFTSPAEAREDITLGIPGKQVVLAVKLTGEVGSNNTRRVRQVGPPIIYEK